MTHKTLGIFIAVTSFLAIAVPLTAHHGAAGYDMEKQLVMKATVTDWLWANPHCFLRYDTTDDKGEVGALDRGSQQSRGHDQARLVQTFLKCGRSSHRDGAARPERRPGRSTL